MANRIFHEWSCVRRYDVPPTTSLKHLLEVCSESVENLFNQDGFIAPIWHAEQEEGEVLVLQTPWSDSTEKDMAAMAAQLLFKQERIKRYVMVSEVWMLERKKGDRSDEEVEEEMRRAFDEGIAEHPDRVEMVIFMGEDVCGTAIQATRDIIRGDREPRLGPLKMMPTAVASGRFLNLLRPDVQH